MFYDDEGSPYHGEFTTGVQFYENNFRKTYINEKSGYPGVEYRVIGRFLGNIISMIRLSVGDFGIMEGSELLSADENIFFWVTFLLMVIIACIIFLNFVISEACASYEKISELREEYIYQDRCKLIAEAEAMAPYMFRKEADYPQYIVERVVDE